MPIRPRILNGAALAAATAAAVATPVWATASPAGPGDAPSGTVALCRDSDISYYYGGYFAGLGQRSFSITLLAHDGVRCRLSDTPQISFDGPSGKRVPATVNGRGGTLVLSPSAPLNLTVFYAVPDTVNDKTAVSTLTLRMPGGGSTQAQPFGYPGTTEIARKVGIGVTSWTTGIGPGQNDSDG